MLSLFKVLMQVYQSLLHEPNINLLNQIQVRDRIRIEILIKKSALQVA